jgi:hypothetical protein
VRCSLSGVTSFELIGGGGIPKPLHNPSVTLSAANLLHSSIAQRILAPPKAHATGSAAPPPPSTAASATPKVKQRVVCCAVLCCAVLCCAALSAHCPVGCRRVGCRPKAAAHCVVCRCVWWSERRANDQWKLWRFQTVGRASPPLSLFFTASSQLCPALRRPSGADTPIGLLYSSAAPAPKRGQGVEIWRLYAGDTYIAPHDTTAIGRFWHKHLFCLVLEHVS